MKMKRIVAMTLSCVMAVGLLSGCGDKKNDDPGTADGVVTIKIGGIGPITGDLAQYGTATDWGAQVAVDEINAKNGPIKLEFQFEDDTGVTDTAVSAYNSLKDWAKDAPLVIYGCTTTDPCVAVASETYADRYFQLTPSASSPDVTAGKNNVFQMCFTDPGQGTAAAEYVKSAGIATKVGVIYNNGSAYSTGMAEAFIAKAKELGLEVVATQTYPADTTTDYNVQVNACKDAGAELVFLPIYYTPASLIMTQAKQSGYNPIFFGGDGMDGMLAVEGFDASSVEGLLLMTPYNVGDTAPRNTTFVESYKKLSGGIEPNQFAADGYDCMYAIYEACCQIEGIADMDSAALCDALAALFTSGTFKVDGLTGTGMSWLTSGEVSKAPMVVKVQNGAYVDP